MSFPRYPAYKSSCVEWLGEVPEHWEEKPLKTVASINDETLPESLSPDYEIEYIDISSVSLANGIEKTETMPFSDAPSRARRIPRDGDVLVSTVRTYLKAIAPVVNPPLNLVASTGFAVVRPRDKLEPGFLKYALQEEHFIQQVISRSTGVSYPAINASDVAKISLGLPGSSEQIAIATFLDRETAKIDALIAEQQRLIELLQEKRQAVISHAVTKGLNPGVPMKDSGVEWLGEVPEHWEVKRLKDISSVIDCRNKTPEYVDEGQYLVVRTTNIKERKLVLDDARYTDERNFKIWTQRGIPRAGSVFFTREAPAGETAVVPEGVPLCMGQRMMNIDASSETLTRYILCFLQSSCLKRYIEACSMGSIVGHLRVPQVENLPLTVPPAGEQKLIARRVAELDATFDEATSCLNASVNLLRERRSALVSAAVTGQIDVRGLAPEANAA